MNTIALQGSFDSPEIVLDGNLGKLNISGRSFPKNVAKTYQPIMEWLNSYSKEPKENTEIVIDLEYYNSASSKCILDILMKLEEVSLSGHQVTVKWNYSKEDPEIKEFGQEYEESLMLNFEYKAY